VNPVRLAIVGATGLVGRTTLEVLEEWQVPLADLQLFASADSSGRTMPFRGNPIALRRLDHVPAGVDVAIFATSRELSRLWVPQFRDAGVLVIDHSSQYRMDPDVPLVIPEINAGALTGHHRLIANPNCSASVVLLPLAALERAIGLKTVIVDTYQSVSGSGQEAIAELDEQLRDSTSIPRVYPRTIAHNVFPQVGEFDTDGICDEERKVVEEIRKILDRPDLAVFTTTVRVPVRVGHSIAATVQCRRETDRIEVGKAFSQMPGMVYESADYRTPREVAGRQEIFVGRLRTHADNPSWLQFWAVGDNLRKGAASNAVQILLEVCR